MDSITFTEYPFEQFEKVCKSVRADHGYEGVVLYFVNASNNVIGLLKKKTIWYIYLRAIREKMKNYLNQLKKDPEGLISISKKVNSDIPSKIKKRFKEIKEWLSIDPKQSHAWTELAIGMSNYLCNNLINKKISFQDIQFRFPVLWNQYLKESKKDDKMEY